MKIKDFKVGQEVYVYSDRNLMLLKEQEAQVYTVAKIGRLLEYIAIHQKWEARSQIVKWRHPADITGNTGSLILHWNLKAEELSS